MPIAPILLWLKGNWKLVALVIGVLCIVSYIGILQMEVSHYKAKAADVETKFALYKEQAEAKQATLEKGAAEISARHEHTLSVLDAELAKSSLLNQQRIAANEELRRTRISLAAVQLLNESTRKPEEPAPAVQGDAPSPTGTEARTVDLSTVFAVVADNNKNHLACTKRLEEWITFWGEYQAVVKEANATP